MYIYFQYISSCFFSSDFLKIQQFYIHFFNSNRFTWFQISMLLLNLSKPSILSSIKYAFLNLYFILFFLSLPTLLIQIKIPHLFDTGFSGKFTILYLVFTYIRYLFFSLVTLFYIIESLPTYISAAKNHADYLYTAANKSFFDVYHILKISRIFLIRDIKENLWVIPLCKKSKYKAPILEFNPILIFIFV